jgi:DNA-binding winged helix-turn-helix (wHTH) protein/Tol biopolymer transport system component
MNAEKNGDRRIRFGVFEADLSARELYKRGVSLRIQDKPFQVLTALLEHPGNLVTREELRNQLWPGGTHVDFEKGLNTAVKKLRAILGDASDNPIFIETVPRRGYRLIAPVTYSREDKNNGSAELFTIAPTEKTFPAHESKELPRVALSVWQRRGTYAVFALAAVLASAFAFWSLARSHTRPGVEILQFTESGDVVTAAIAPDGRYVAYVADHGQSFSLRLRQIATRNEAVILAPELGQIAGLTFSPSSDYLYFVRADKNDNEFRYLYRVPLIGGSVQKMIEDVDSVVSFSPDGKQLSYEHFVPPDNKVELKVANVDGSNQHVVAVIPHANFTRFGPGLSWSPDGKSLAVSVLLINDPRRWVIATVSIRDGSFRELFHSSKRVGRPVWNPNGDQLVVPLSGAVPHHDAQLWTIAFPSGAARQITSSLSGFTDNLDISRDGTTLAAVTRAERSDLWWVSADDPAKGEQITNGEPALFGGVQLADESILAFSDSGLWKLSPDGKHRSLFFADANRDFDASPCGKFAVFTSLTGEATAVMRADNSGGHLAALTDAGNPLVPVCSPDGKYVYYLTVEQPQGVWRIPVGGGKPHLVARVMGDSFTGELNVSPDGRFLVYPFTKYTNTTPGWHLAVVSTLDGSSRSVLDLPSLIGSPHLSHDGTAIQYFLFQDGVTNLWERSLTGEPPRQLTHFGTGRILDFSWSNDRRRLLLARGEFTNNVVLIRNFR